MTHPDLDRHAFDELRTVLPEATFRTLLAAQIDDVKARVVRLADADTPEQIAREAHDLVSSAGNFGFARLSQTARTIEVAARAGRPCPAETRAMLPVLAEAALAAVEAALA